MKDTAAMWPDLIRKITLRTTQALPGGDAQRAVLMINTR
jgi:hypothetical protein